MSLLMKVALDADKGKWVTINGSHIHINEKGEPDKGNPNVIRGMEKGNGTSTGSGSNKGAESSSEKTSYVDVGYNKKMPKNAYAAVSKILPFTADYMHGWGDGKEIDIEGGHKASLAFNVFQAKDNSLILGINNSPDYEDKQLEKNIRWNPNYRKQVQEAMIPYGKKIGNALKELGYQVSVRREREQEHRYVVIEAKKG